MFLAAFFCRFYRVWADFSFLHLLDNCFGFCFSFFLISRNMFMFIVCFIHSFWTCGNQNQQCNYTFCCLCGTGSGWVLWWGQQFSCKVSINLLALLDWCFSPVDKSPPCKSSFPASLLFTARAGGDLSPKCFCSPVTLSNHYLSTGEGFYILAPPLTLVPAITSTAAVFCLPSRSSAFSTFWFHLPSVIALGMMRNIRRGLVTALLYVVSSCCGHDWAEPTGSVSGLLEIQAQW